MVKNYSNSERGNPLPPHRLFFPIISNFFYMHHLTDFGRKEMFYLMTHSTHFILRLYGIGHMVTDHSDSERGNPLLPQRLFFLIISNFFYMHHLTDRIAHTTAFGRKEMFYLMTHSTHFILRLYGNRPLR